MLRPAKQVKVFWQDHWWLPSWGWAGQTTSIKSFGTVRRPPITKCHTHSLTKNIFWFGLVCNNLLLCACRARRWGMPQRGWWRWRRMWWWTHRPSRPSCLRGRKASVHRRDEMHQTSLSLCCCCWYYVRSLLLVLDFWLDFKLCTHLLLRLRTTWNKMRGGDD